MKAAQLANDENDEVLPAVTASTYSNDELCYINRPRKLRQGSVAVGQRPSFAQRRQHSVLMDPSVRNYQKLVKSAREFMSDEIEKLPLSKYE